MKKLLLTAAICIAIAPTSAGAQCTYRINDVGRPHGYLSGPCNGAAQNYAGANRSVSTHTPRTLAERTPSREYFAKPLAGPTHNGGYFVKRGNRIRVWRPDGTFGGTVVEHAHTVSGYRADGSHFITVRR